MIVLDGKKTSEGRLKNLGDQILKLPKSQRRPGLVVVRVGEDPASKVYVGKKLKTCESLGFHSQEIHLPNSTTESELVARVEALNSDPRFHGILVQLPLPRQISVSRVIESLHPQKDVDGFHPFNLGKLACAEPSLVACTPLGIMNLLSEYQIDLTGKRAVVMGRSRIVGRPMSLLLDQAGATVTIIHRETPEPTKITQEADILVVATGVPRLVGANYVKDGAVVIDVGIHRTEDGRLCGDVKFEELKTKVSAMTPVPGGVGPMTICSLLENTWKTFKDQEFGSAE